MAVATLLRHLLFIIYSVMDTALGSTVHSVLQPAPAGVRTYNIDEKYSDVFTVSEDGSDDFLLQV